MQAFLRSAKAATISALLIGLTGCTLLRVKNLQPVVAPPAEKTCTDLADLLAHEPPPIPGRSIRYELPPDFKWRSQQEVAQYKNDPTVATFVDYDNAIAARVSKRLPATLATDPVTVAFRRFLTAISAEAQLESLVADGTVKPDDPYLASEAAHITKYAAAPKLNHVELKNFTKHLFELQLKHGAADFISTEPIRWAVNANLAVLADSRPRLDTFLVPYLAAYYDGKFYDRLSTAISKPQLPTSIHSLENFAVPDSEIVAAETVLLEFLIDCIDPTPVMGDTAAPTSSTTYFPGKSKNEPTALTAKLAAYVVLPKDGCGITQQNAWVLKDLAGSASDQAATVGGLVANTPGGISLGLGIVGKLSIGDNQTLSDLVKTAASELALRATLATSFYTLRHVNFPLSEPSYK